MDVGPTQAHRRWSATAVGDDVALCPWTPATGRLGSGDFTPFRRDGRAVHAGPAPIDMTGAMKLLEQRAMQPLLDAGQLPVPQSAPAGDARATSHLQRQHAPGNAAPQDKPGPGQGGTVWDPRLPASCGPGRWRQKRFDDGPEGIGDKRGGHNPPIQQPEFARKEFCNALLAYDIIRSAGTLEDHGHLPWCAPRRNRRICRNPHWRECGVSSRPPGVL